MLLGAGYDSRPYRFGKLIQDTQFFELDAPPTQQRKLSCLRQAEIAISQHIHFVPINFETDPLGEVLTTAGFKCESRTLFIWEGVSYYLSREAVDGTLAAVRSNSPAGSVITFDYAALSAETLRDDGVQQFRKLMRTRHGSEPTRFGVPAGQIEAFLSERGFQLLEHLSAAEMDDKYLPRKDEADIGRVSPLFCLAQARVI